MARNKYKKFRCEEDPHETDASNKVSMVSTSSGYSATSVSSNSSNSKRKSSLNKVSESIKGQVFIAFLWSKKFLLEQMNLPLANDSSPHPLLLN
jgi:hypothetical protein